MPEATLGAILTTSFLVGLSGAVAPGPLLVFNFQESLRVGFRAGPLVSLGHALLELLVVVLLALGLTRLLHQDAAAAFIGLAGGAFLLWMAWGLVRRPPPPIPISSASRGPDSRTRSLGPMLGGVLVSLSNPYWALWWLTAGATFLVWAQGLGASGVGVFYVGHILADFSWYSLVAWAAASGRRWISPKAYQRLLLGCGLFLAGMGGGFVWEGVRALN